MLKITIPESEQWDEQKQEFVYTKECSISLEHSLISLHKWEAKWNKPFLGKDEKTDEELLDYIRCMTVSQSVDQNVYNALTKENIKDIFDYISAPMTATTFRSNANNRNNKEILTAEIIYYWMVAFNIPFECQKWHLNQLLTLIRVCNIKNQSNNKMSQKEILKQNAELNALRKKNMEQK